MRNRDTGRGTAERPSASKILGGGATITALKFEQCYSTYRNIILGFRPKPVPTIGNVIDLIAHAQKRRIDLWPHWSRRYKNLRSLNRARKELLTRKLQYFRIDWRKLLPPNRPRIKVDLNLTTRLAQRAFLLYPEHRHALVPRRRALFQRRKVR